MNRIEEIKEIIITSLGLEDVSNDDIDAEAPLFGEGLDLDSIDALELGKKKKKKYDIILDPNSDDMKEYFHSVSSLNKFIEKSINSKEG